jgi:hypothetical protein
LLALVLTLRQSAAMHPALRFLLACLASALAALLVVDLGWVLIEMFSGESRTSLAEALGASIMLLPWVLLIGGIVALPLAAIAGGAMLAFENGRGQPLPLGGWLGAGLAAGLMIVLLFGGTEMTSDRIFVAVWFGTSGMLGAWAFRAVWHRRQRADRL